MANNIIRKRFTFIGRVQGVGFRWTAKFLANEIGLTGWVRNAWGGDVQMEVQGTKAQINGMVNSLRRERFIRIERIEECELPVVTDERGFTVKF